MNGGDGFGSAAAVKVLIGDIPKNAVAMLASYTTDKCPCPSAQHPSLLPLQQYIPLTQSVTLVTGSKGVFCMTGTVSIVQ